MRLEEYYKYYLLLYLKNMTDNNLEQEIEKNNSLLDSIQGDENKLNKLIQKASLLKLNLTEIKEKEEEWNVENIINDFYK